MVINYCLGRRIVSSFLPLTRDGKKHDKHYLFQFYDVEVERNILDMYKRLLFVIAASLL